MRRSPWRAANFADHGRSLLALPLATLERPLVTLCRWERPKAALRVLRRVLPLRRAEREDFLGALVLVLVLRRLSKVQYQYHL